MKTEELLEKYFDGRTTCEEEKKLRDFFSRSKLVPEHLKVYRPLFVYLDDEVRRNKTVNPMRKAATLKRYMFYTLGSVAVGLLLIFGIARYWSEYPNNYVFIDGRQYTDINLVQQQAQSALDEVRFSKDEVFAVLFAE
jgi:hypothetical protein